MAEFVDIPTGETPPDSKANKAAENAVLKLVARYSMVAIIPLITGFGGVGLWVANKVWESVQAGNRETNDTLKATNSAVNDLRIMITGITGNQTLLNSRIDVHADRFKGVDERNTQQDQRMDRQDNKIDAIQLRVLGRGNP